MSNLINRYLIVSLDGHIDVSLSIVKVYEDLTDKNIKILNDAIINNSSSSSLSPEYIIKNANNNGIHSIGGNKYLIKIAFDIDNGDSIYKNKKVFVEFYKQLNRDCILDTLLK